MHVDGFRFDLGSILTRAHSTWHPTEPGAEREPAAPLSGGAATDGHGTRLYSPENGMMKLRLSLLPGVYQAAEGVCAPDGVCVHQKQKRQEWSLAGAQRRPCPSCYSYQRLVLPQGS